MNLHLLLRARAAAGRPVTVALSSSYYLPFDLGDPNADDRPHDYTGSQLMVHRTCSSARCYVMTDKAVGEIYARRCFREYHVLPDASGRYAALYRPTHMIGLELGIAVASAALRREPTGAPIGFFSDVVATAKRALEAGELLDGEGGYCVWAGSSRPSARSPAASCRSGSRTASSSGAASRRARCSPGAMPRSTRPIRRSARAARWRPRSACAPRRRAGASAMIPHQHPRPKRAAGRLTRRRQRLCQPRGQATRSSSCDMRSPRSPCRSPFFCPPPWRRRRSARRPTRRNS